MEGNTHTQTHTRACSYAHTKKNSFQQYTQSIANINSKLLYKASFLIQKIPIWKCILVYCWLILSLLVFLHTFSFIEQPFFYALLPLCVLSTYVEFQVGRKMGALLYKWFNTIVLIEISINRDRDSPSKRCPLIILWGVPVVAQQVMNLTTIHEDVGSSLSFAQCVKDLALLWAVCGIGQRCSSNLLLLWLRCRLAAIAPIWPLAWELPFLPQVWL